MAQKKTFKSVVLECAWKVLQHSLPSKMYLSIKYLVVFKRRIHWNNPQTFSEKLQWLKLYGTKPEYTMMVDKVLVKEHVSKIIGDKYVIPTIKVWNSASEICLDELPTRFVLKCNHDSGQVLVCQDKSTLREEEVQHRMNKYFRTNYYLMGRETPYKHISKRIFAEDFIQDEETHELRDYKFFCFNGEPKLMFVASDRSTDVKFDFYDMDFNHLPFRQGYNHANKQINKPRNFDLMKELATKLSKGIPHVRIDLYEANGRVYFGEMTFYHFSGFMPFEPEEWDLKLGSWIKLPRKNVNA